MERKLTLRSVSSRSPADPEPGAQGKHDRNPAHLSPGRSPRDWITPLRTFTIEHSPLCLEACAEWTPCERKGAADNFSPTKFSVGCLRSVREGRWKRRGRSKSWTNDGCTAAAIRF
ncbi:hypothetical protein TNCV_1692621 [Trichonephila clavipes]|nr:hypothetical protein TNCV_1692621 [Trichonephila clavipes]